VAIAALKHKARLNGVEMPAKVAMTNSTSEDLVPIPLATIRKTCRDRLDSTLFCLRSSRVAWALN
jgi:hypothetical protein